MSDTKYSPQYSKQEIAGLSISGANFPVISVITAVFNRKNTLEACILSVHSQTYPSVEYIVIDGASTDGSVDLIKKHSDKIDRWISESDSGIYNALNKGINLCTGSFYLFLGSDDVLLPNALEVLYNHMGSMLVVQGLSIYQPPGGGNEKLIRAHSGATLISMQAHERFGLYDESYRIAADAKFLAVVRKNNLVKEINETVGIFSPGGASSNYLPTILEHARAMKESGQWGSVYCFYWVLLRKIRHYIRTKFRKESL
jgi:glycosyltransferase involved in cell wall biosynthesis